MDSKNFRFDFKGQEGKKDNSYLIIKHEPPLQRGEVQVALSNEGDSKKRKKALFELADMLLSLRKPVKISRWNYYDAVMVETHEFDAGLGVLMSSQLETRGAVPGGSTKNLKLKLKEEGHELKENNIFLADENARERKPLKILRLFRFKKRGIER